MENSCHQQDQNTTPEQTSTPKESVNCCQTMTGCHGTQLFVNNTSLELAKLELDKIQLSITQAVVLNTQAPPLPPPKAVI